MSSAIAQQKFHCACIKHRLPYADINSCEAGANQRVPTH